MRLINTKTRELKEFWGRDIPQRYAVLSHTWEEEEVTFQQFMQLSREEQRKLKGYKKIAQTCYLAQRSGIEWAWVDTCCIDKSSSAELTEAINSMFRWYQESYVCYAYLSDLKSNESSESKKSKEIEQRDGDRRSKENEQRDRDKKSKASDEVTWKEDDSQNEEWRGEGGRWWDATSTAKRGDTKAKGKRWKDDWKSDATSSTAQSESEPLFRQRIERLAKCRWFTRGWTLQELIAPPRLGFYNQDWEFEGEKKTLSAELAEITRINKRVLDNAALLSTIPVAQRMAWAASRQTTRAEDMAYCLLGIFGVQIPMLYGEGNKAFIRLQEEIIKESNDLSLFAWRTKATSQKYWGILALEPKDFADCTDIELWDDPMYNDEFVVTSKGLRVTPVAGGGLRSGRDATYVLNLGCYRRGSDQDLGIFLKQHGCDVYTRVFPDQLSETKGVGREVAEPRMFYISKIVSPVLAVMLASSHRNGIDLSRAKEALKKARYQLHERSIEPAGHWDTQRSLFLTQGLREFSCRLRFTSWSGQKQEPLVLKCSLREGRVSAHFSIETSPGKYASGRVLQKEDSHGIVVDWLRAGVREEAVNGQLVHFVTVDVLS